MSSLVYRIEFFSDWHCGSGLTSGADLDSLAIKDFCGLPYIPGKTLKGLLREAAQELTRLQANAKEWQSFMYRCFGHQSDKNTEQSQQGACYFSNAELSQNLKEKLAPDGSPTLKTRKLFRKVSSTAVGEDGQAKEHSLRRIEVTVPLVLFAEITNCPKQDRDKLKKCMKWVKRLGSHRHRGLGRCKLEIKE